MFKREMFYFGILQRDEKAVNLIDSLVSEEQKEYGSSVLIFYLPVTQVWRTG